MTEQKFVYVDVDYLKELEETAKKVDYYKGIIDGIMMCKDEPQTHEICTNTHECVKNTHDKTESSNSEKPNNCEHITEDGVTCVKYPACDDCLDNPLNKVKGSERLVKGSEQTEPTISKMEQVETMSCQECKHFHENAVMYLDQCDFCFKDCKYEPKDEPQTQLTAKCLECNNSKACKENHWEGCRYEPLGYEVTAVVGTMKDEPQTERSE